MTTPEPHKCCDEGFASGGIRDSSESRAIIACTHGEMNTPKKLGVQNHPTVSRISVEEEVLTNPSLFSTLSKKIVWLIFVEKVYFPTP